MKKTFVTYLGSQQFLPGIVALNESLQKYNPNIPLIIMVQHDLPNEAIVFLNDNHFDIKIVDEIKRPNFSEADERDLHCVYDKLWIFGLTEYDKLVYIDADMLVCENMESLFEKPHFSAVTAGALMPQNKEWVKLNSGLMVVEPNSALFNHMVSMVAELPVTCKSDQDFLHSYFPGWPAHEELHLHHRYNVPAPCIETYCALHDFSFSYVDKSLHTKNISVIHYWGPYKPWDYDEETLAVMGESAYKTSIQLWWDYFEDATEKLRFDITEIDQPT